MGGSLVSANLLKPRIDKKKISQLVDLGSGSGGPMPRVVELLSTENRPVQLLLTDLYPNKSVVNNYKEFNGVTHYS